jgi:hypothetical protein
MIKVHFVVDGPRDHLMIPLLIEKILGRNIQPISTTAWKEVHLSAGKGYPRKLLFAIRKARADGADAVVATVDTDASNRRAKLRELEEARRDDRSRAPSLPTAIGEANPHADAWLLADQVAMRRALGFDENTKIPNVDDCRDPRTAVDNLIEQSENFAGQKKSEILGAIARQVVPSRCGHQKETGFKTFADDVKSEFRSLLPQCGPDCRCGDACAASE